MLVVGTRDGRWLSFVNAEPYLSYADPLPAPPDVFILGVIHRGCDALAFGRLRRQGVRLRSDLPRARVEEPAEEEMELDNLGLPPRGGRCAFCGADEASEEHVFPRWISRALQTRGELTIRRDHGPQPVRLIPVVTNSVCRLCNNTWLSVLENDTRPILEPMLFADRAALNPDEQRILATWAFKTALMLDLAGDQQIAVGFHREFAIARQPPRDALVWIGGYMGPMAVVALEQALQLGAPDDELPKALVSTFTVGRCLFQVAQHFTRGGWELKDTRPIARGLHRIWQPRGWAVEWPRRQFGYSEQGLAEVAGRITEDSHSNDAHLGS